MKKLFAIFAVVLVVAFGSSASAAEIINYNQSGTNPETITEARAFVKESGVLQGLFDGMIFGARQSIAEKKRSFENKTAYSSSPIGKCVKDYFEWSRQIYEASIKNNFNMEGIASDIALIYSDIFTTDELKQLKKFSLSAAGQNLIRASANLEKADPRFANDVVEFQISDLGMKEMESNEEIQQRTIKSPSFSNALKSVMKDIYLKSLEYKEYCPEIEKYNLM